LGEVERRQIATVALCEWYAAKALQLFRKYQAMDTFWNNQTETAYNTVFAENYVLGNEAGWFIAHAVEYGVYLEIANDRKHEALRPIVMELFPEFQKDLREIWE